VATTIKLPELGENVDSGDLVRILVSPGDTISKDQPLVELETEKATIEVPSPVSGVVKELLVQEGRKVKVGDPLFTIEENGAGAKPEQARRQPQKNVVQQQPAPAQQTDRQAAPPAAKQAPSSTSTSHPTGAAATRARAPEPQTDEESRPEARPQATRRKPQAQQEQTETKQAEPQPPSSKPELRAEPRAEVKREPLTGEEMTGEEAEASTEEENDETVIPFRPEPAEPPRRALAPASPSIRRLARELGIDIGKVTGSGPEGHITEQDVKNYARDIISRSVSRVSGGVSFTEMPDFAKWGEIERKPMTNVRRATAEHLAQAWHSVPQVTQFDAADVTELENLRTRFTGTRDSDTPKITVTAIALKIVAAALEKFPQFAASIDMANREIIYKHYINIGVAVDTSYGLVVPVIRDANRKSIPQLAAELTELSEKARDKKLSPADMAGGVFTITNLGGIGGTAFSPIVNYPEVAILGISRVSMEPRHIDGAFQPRKILPISLSYDHRLIDGADAARFLRWVAEALEEPALLLFRS
jgi:pyruvate dehydrogenase E2 component (dihydrolipoamide acetyltransferase)